MHVACYGLNLARRFVTRTRRLTSAEGRIFRIGDMPYPKSCSNSQEEKRTIRLLVVHAGVDIIDFSQLAEQCANCITILCPPDLNDAWKLRVQARSGC